MPRKRGKRHYFPRMTRHRRSPRHFGRYFRRHHDRRFPLSVGIGLGVSLMAPPANGWSTVMDNLKAGRMDMAMQSFVNSWTGLAIGGIGGQQNTSFNMTGLINPFDFGTAPALKATLWSAIAFKIAKRVIHQDPLAKVPIVGKMVKMA